MAFVQITAVRTADPANVWAAKSSFFANDPFAIVMDFQISSDILQAGLRYDAVFQMVNPRDDPYRGSWFSIEDYGVLDFTTNDRHWRDVAFQWTHSTIWWSWPRYANAVSHIRGAERVDGIFFVRGTVNVRGSSLFARSGEFWYKVRP